MWTASEHSADCRSSFPVSDVPPEVAKNDTEDGVGGGGGKRSAVAGGVDEALIPPLPPLLFIDFPLVVSTQSTMPHLQLVPATAPPNSAVSVASVADDGEDDDVVGVLLLPSAAVAAAAAIGSAAVT